MNSINVVVMLGQRSRRWTNITTPLIECGNIAITTAPRDNRRAEKTNAAVKKQKPLLFQITDRKIRLLCELILAFLILTYMYKGKATLVFEKGY